MHPLTLSAFRFIGAGVIFACIYFFTSYANPRAEEAEIDRKALWVCLLSGGTNGITISAFYGALQFIDAGLTSVLGIALYPAITLILLAFAGEAFTTKRIVRLTLVFIGLYFLLGVSGTIDMRGVGLVALAASMYAVHVVTVQWYLSDNNVVAITSLMMMGAAIVVFFIWLAFGAPTYVAGTRGYLVIVYQIILLTLVARLLTYFAINKIGSGQMALITPVETVLTVIWSMLFLSERLRGPEWIGAGLILVSALLAAEFRRKQQPQPA